MGTVIQHKRLPGQVSGGDGGEAGTAVDAAAFAGSNRFGRVSRALQVEKLLILHGIDCDIDMLLISCDMLLCRQSDTTCGH